LGSFRISAHRGKHEIGARISGCNSFVCGRNIGQDRNAQIGLNLLNACQCPVPLAADRTIECDHVGSGLHQVARAGTRRRNQNLAILHHRFLYRDDGYRNHSPDGRDVLRTVGANARRPAVNRRFREACN